jgi:hypothetical protein
MVVRAIVAAMNKAAEEPSKKLAAMQAALESANFTSPSTTSTTTTTTNSINKETELCPNSETSPPARPMHPASVSPAINPPIVQPSSPHD